MSSNMNIKRRAFGADIEIDIKKKLEARQKASWLTQKPNQEIIESRYTDNGKTPPGTFEYHLNNQLQGVADLSSNQPFARMWTAVILKQKKDGGGYPVKLDLDYDGADAAERSQAKRDLILHHMSQPNTYYDSIKEEINQFEDIMNEPKVYMIGNHTTDMLNTEKPLDSIQGQESGGTYGYDYNALFPSELQSGGTEENAKQLHHHHPPAGITGISAETQGTFGHVVKTQVNFFVHSLRDFERIFQRYFLRPGAQVFLDFGWSNVKKLYNPQDILTANSTDNQNNQGSQDNLLNSIEGAIYGEDGIVAQGNGDLLVNVGNVINYDAKRTEGGYECMLEFVSKNAVILESVITNSMKHKLGYGIDIEILRWAVNFFAKEEKTGDEYVNQNDLSTSVKTIGLTTTGNYVGAGVVALNAFNPNTEEFLQGTNFAAQAGHWSTSAQSFDETQQVMMKFAANNLGGQGTQGMDAWTPGVIAKQFGIFSGGKASENKLFVSIGWLEDNILNGLFGSFGRSGGYDTGLQKEQFATAFDSSNSFLTFSKFMFLSQAYRGIDNDFLYPATWDSGTYSEIMGKVPDDRRDENGNFLTIDKKHLSNYGIVNVDATDDEGQPVKSWTKIDTAEGRVPIRECFISTKILKTVAKSAPTSKELMKGIIDTIKNATDNIIDLTIKSTDDTNTKFELLDKHIGLSAKHQSNSTWFENLFVFNPGSPNSIVESYELSYSMPEGNLANQTAIQQMSGKMSLVPLNQMVDDSLCIERLYRHQNENQVIEYQPNIGREQMINMMKYQQSESDITSMGKMPQMFNDQHIQSKMSIYQTDRVPITINRTDNDQTYHNQLEAAGSDELGLREERQGAIERAWYSIAPVALGGSDAQSQGHYDVDATEIDAEKDAELKALAGINSVSSVLKYYMELARREVFAKRKNLLPYELTISIYGVSGIGPGDIFRCNDLPKMWYDNCYFQVKSVSHEVGDGGWVTTLTCFMRIHNLIKTGGYIPTTTTGDGSDDGDVSDDGFVSDSLVLNANYDRANTEFNAAIFTTEEFKYLGLPAKTVLNMDKIKLYPGGENFTNIDAVFTFICKEKKQMGLYNFWWVPSVRGRAFHGAGKDEFVELMDTMPEGAPHDGDSTSYPDIFPDIQFENNGGEDWENAYEYIVNPLMKGKVELDGTLYVMIIKWQRVLICKAGNIPEQITAWAKIGEDPRLFMTQQEIQDAGLSPYDNLNENKRYDSKGGFLYGNYTGYDVTTE